MRIASARELLGADGPFAAEVSGFTPRDCQQDMAEAVEEAILNALVAAETMTGFQGHTVYALPHDLLVKTMRKWNHANKSAQLEK